MDADIAFVVDGSRGVGADLYRVALTLVDAVLDELEVSRQPSTSPHGARVALVTHTTPSFWPGEGRSPVLEGFHLTAYGHLPSGAWETTCLGHFSSGAWTRF